MRTAATFLLAAARYWVGVFPRTCGQLRRLRRRASQIEDPTLRGLALEALAKRGNIEGAAAFAAFIGSRRRRRAATDALVLFQAIYNHADTLAEQPSPDPEGNARQLHGALLDALRGDCLAGGAARAGDGGYLAELAGECRSALARLPGFAELSPIAGEAAERIVCFQSLGWQGPASPLERWALNQAPAASGLAWWEVAGAAGSSLVVHATIAAAASAKLVKRDVEAIGHAYFPWVCALHSLLDSLLDEREDALAGQLSLIGCYESGEQARARLRRLAGAAREAARSLPGGRRHELLLAAMVAHYLSELDEQLASSPALARSSLLADLREQLGWPLRLALAVFRARRAATGAWRTGPPVTIVRGRAPREQRIAAAVELEDA